MTTAQLVRGGRPRCTTRPRGMTGTLHERLLERLRTVAVVTLAGMVTLAGVVVPPLWVAVGAAAVRVVHRERAGLPAGPALLLRDVARGVPPSWLSGTATLAGLLLALVNLVGLWGVASLQALVLIVLNTAAGGLLLLFGAACMRELGDDMALSPRELARRAVRRTVTLGRWHVLVVAALLAWAGAALLSPPAAVIVGPGVVLLATCTPDPAHPDKGDTP